MAALELDLESRIKAYILNVELFINTVEKQELPPSSRSIVELARAYLSDAKYYFEKGDYATSLSCIAYAEGLLDALRHLGLVKGVDWKPLSMLARRPRVLVAGSFEFLHPGHLALLRYAWEHGDVYVVVSRDVNFEKFKKRKPALSEQERLEVVKSIKYVASAVLGDEQDFFKPIEELKPDVIVLGPDQWITPEELQVELKKRGLEGTRVVKMPERIGNWSSSSILGKICENLRAHGSSVNAEGKS